jgi:hypothetical protein
MDGNEYETVDGMSGRETEVLGENLPQSRSVHYISNMT